MNASCRFGSLDVRYDASVLRPRLWTLLQSDWAAELSPRLPPGRLLELCAGVGHIGLEAAVRTGRGLVQVEIDPHAAAFARHNAATAGVRDHDVRERDLGEAVGVRERFPLILADPPYIPSTDVAAFPDDPRLAIDGGDDGLSVMRACVGVAAAHLVPGGALLLQTRGESQARAVDALSPDGLAMREVRAVDPDRAVALFLRA